MRRARVGGAWAENKTYPRVAGAWKLPSAGVIYFIDRISDATAYLYPYSDIADSPRVSGKYVTVDAATLNPTVLPSPLSTNTGELPQTLDSNAVGYIDVTITRNGLGSGNFLFFRYESDTDRYELNTNGSTIASFRVYKRDANAVTNLVIVTGQFAASTPYQVGLRINGGLLTGFVAGSQVFQLTSGDTGLAEATIKGGGDSGITVTNTKIYPLTVTL